MNRRKFLTWLGLGSLASWLTAALSACFNDATIPSSAPSNASSASNSTASRSRQSGGFVQMGTIQDLEQKGRLLSSQIADDSVLVIRDPNNSNELYAVSSICTHRGCPVNWNTDTQKLFCPCHGSKFNPDGSIVHGPATKPLKRYAVKLKGDAVLVNSEGVG